MAHFMGTVQGSRGPVSRLGGKGGLRVNANGWNCGVAVYARYDEKLKKDVFEVYENSGSGHGRETKLIATVTAD